MSKNSHISMSWVLPWAEECSVGRSETTRAPVPVPVPDPTQRPNWIRDAVLSFTNPNTIHFLNIFQRINENIYIRKYHFNIKGTHHLIKKNYFFYSIWYFMPILSIYHFYILRHYKPFSIPKSEFVQKVLNIFHECMVGALLQLREALTLTLNRCGLFLRTCSLGTCAMIKQCAKHFHA